MKNFSMNGAALTDIMRPKSSGRVVNGHVVEAPPSLRPDFERMRREVHGVEPVEKPALGEDADKQ